MSTQATAEAIELIQRTELAPDPNQPRTYFDKDGLQELANDIAVRGIMEPILYFTDKDGQKTILAGERRWRAAELAGLETLPCLYRDSGTEIDRLLDQVSENFQREGLNPIEMAHFFDQLIDKHGISATELGPFLVKYGFKNFDRSYITNIRRLLKLPKWAKIKIQKKELTAAHGKYLLQALASKPVMKDMQAFLKKQTPTTAELQEEIEDAYDKHHFDVAKGKPHPQYSWQAIPVKFDYTKACKGCKTCQTIKGEFRSVHYCLNESCYDKKQEEAIEKIQKAEAAKAKREAAQAKKEREKREAELIEMAEQQGVPVAELIEKEAKQNPPEPDPRAHGRFEKTQQYLDEWLRKQLDTHMLEDEATRYKIILWMAAGAPGDACSNWNGPGSVDIDLDSEMEDHGIDITLQNKLDPLQLELMTCTAGINSMDRANLRKLAHYVGVVLTGFYIVDREYLEIKSKNELIESTPQAVINSWDDGHWEKICKKPTGFIIDSILNKDHLYGVPDDLSQMYNQQEAWV